MSEETSTTARCECGHEWNLRKPVAEMTEGPRCSECGATGEPISIEHYDYGQTSEDQNSPGILQRVEQRAILEELIDRVETNLDRIETATSSDSEVPRELQGPHRRFRMLLEELQDEKSVPLDELDRVESYIESLEGELDDCPELSEIDELESQIDARQSELQRLDQKIATRKEQFDELESAHRDLRNLWKHAKSKGRLYRQGLAEGFQFGQQHPNAGTRDLVEAVEYPFDEADDELEIKVV